MHFIQIDDVKAILEVEVSKLIISQKFRNASAQSHNIILLCILVII